MRRAAKAKTNKIERGKVTPFYVTAAFPKGEQP
jgi:hypothetical protein